MYIFCFLHRVLNTSLHCAVDVCLSRLRQSAVGIDLKRVNRYWPEPKKENLNGPAISLVFMTFTSANKSWRMTWMSMKEKQGAKGRHRDKRCFDNKYVNSVCLLHLLQQKHVLSLTPVFYDEQRRRWTVVIRQQFIHPLFPILMSELLTWSLSGLNQNWVAGIMTLLRRIIVVDYLSSECVEALNHEYNFRKQWIA